MKYLLSCLLCIWVNLCWSKNSQVVPVVLDEKLTIYCEIADTPEKLTQGFMFRKKLHKTQGMLFIFPYNNNWSFWMKNTFIPLDIIWLNENKEVVYIQHDAPPCTQKLNCKQYFPPASIKAKYVLEITAGLTTEHKLSIYKQLKF
jgi:hypothetical protein